MIKVACETREFKDREDNLIGTTVSHAYEAVKVLNSYPEKDKLRPEVNKSSVSWDYVLKEDDYLEFVMKSREKGSF